MSSAMNATMDGHTLNRPKLDLNVGAFVRNEGQVYRITEMLDFGTVVGLHVETGRSAALRIKELQPVVEAPAAALASSSKDLDEIGDESWRIAQQRFAAIKPLLTGLVSRREVEQRAKEISVDVTTLYRWLRRYRALGVLTALIPAKRGWKAGRSRISKDTDDVIAEVLREKYLTEQRCSAQKAIREVHRVCAERGVPLPHPMTVRNRIASLSERSVLRSRGFRERAARKFQPAPGSFPNANFPLAVVQIDHTPADIILVDDVHRKPIGRPWITLAIDVYSRMVTGYYLSFDPPSETSVAMCVAHSILPKDEWLQLHSVDAGWDVWGMMSTIHVDNGAEFRSDNFRNACVMHNINLEYRPVKQPRYGGHIERLLGTLLSEIHDLPGTTFSSIKDREGYDSDKHAAMTKSEFERWLVTLICKMYHQRLHRGIGMTPARRWELGIFGGAGVQGRGLPQRPADRLSLLLDFLPTFRRTVQAYGVEIDGRRYYADVLRPWINVADPKEPGGKRQFIFRRDPRDISEVWFRDPALGQYYRIPFANQALPPMSAWEHDQARARLKAEGSKSVDDAQVLRALTELRDQVDQAKEKTRRARRQSQRRQEHAKGVSPVSPLTGLAGQDPGSRPTPAVSGLIDGVVDAFEEIE
jgi:putative transposase